MEANNLSTFNARGLPLRLSYLVGQVTSSQTRTSSSISGGAIEARLRSDVYSHTMRVSATPISSTETLKRQIFVRVGPSRELEVNLIGDGIGFHEGQWVTLLRIDNGTHWNYAGILNHNTISTEIWHNNIEGLVSASSNSSGDDSGTIGLLGSLSLLIGAGFSHRAAIVIGVLLIAIAIASHRQLMLRKRRAATAASSVQQALGVMAEQVRSGAWAPPF